MTHAHTISLIRSSFQKPVVVETEPIKFEISSIPKILLKVEISNKNQVLKENFCVPEKNQTCILRGLRFTISRDSVYQVLFFINLKGNFSLQYHIQMLNLEHNTYHHALFLF